MMRAVMFGALTIACAAPVSAIVAITTVTGVVADAQGNVGAESPFGPIVAGQAYSLIYTIDDGISGAAINSGAYGQRVSGPGSVTAALTLNGVTRWIGGQSISLAENRNAEPDSGRLFDRVIRSAQDFSYVPDGLYSDAFVQTSVGSYLSDYLADGNYTTPFTYVPVSADSYLSSAHFNIYDFATRTQLVNVYLSLAPGQVTSAIVSDAVPEPATWLAMVGGFAMIGASLRRRSERRAAL